METRPKMGEKNCTRACKRGRAPAAEMKRLQAGSERATEASKQASRRHGEPADGERRAYEKDTWYRLRLAVCVKPVREVTRCRRIVTLRGRCMCLHYHHLTHQALTTRPVEPCRSTVTGPRVLAPRQPNACSRRRCLRCTPSSGMLELVRMQSIITRNSSSSRCLG